MHLPALTDRELVRYADSTSCALSSTELELELINRFAARLDELEAIEAVTQADAADLLAVLKAKHIQDPDDLRQILERDAQMGATLARYADTSATFATT